MDIFAKILIIIVALEHFYILYIEILLGKLLEKKFLNELCQMKCSQKRSDLQQIKGFTMVFYELDFYGRFTLEM